MSEPLVPDEVWREAPAGSSVLIEGFIGPMPLPDPEPDAAEREPDPWDWCRCDWCR